MAQGAYDRMGWKTEGVGFEPTVPFGTPVFKTGAINHSTTPPGPQPISDQLPFHDVMTLP